MQAEGRSSSKEHKRTPEIWRTRWLFLKSRALTGTMPFARAAHAAACVDHSQMVLLPCLIQFQPFQTQKPLWILVPYVHVNVKKLRGESPRTVNLRWSMEGQLEGVVSRQGLSWFWPKCAVQIIWHVRSISDPFRRMLDHPAPSPAL